MPSPDEWANKEGTGLLFKLKEGLNVIMEFLNVGKANRYNTVRQAQFLTTLRFYGDYLKSQGLPDAENWCHQLCDYVEDYQVTMVGYSRLQTLRAILSERFIEQEKGKYIALTGTGVPGK